MLTLYTLKIYNFADFGQGSYTKRISKQDNTATRMSSSKGSRRARRPSPDWNGGEQQYANGSQHGSSDASRQQGDTTISPHANNDIGPLATIALEASQRFLDSQKAATDLIEACQKHEDERQKYPRLLHKYNKLKEQVTPKDVRINKLLSTISTMREESSATEEDKKQVLRDKEALAKRSETVERRLEVRAAELNLEGEKKISKELEKMQAELKSQSEARIKVQETRLNEKEKSMDDRVKDLEDKLRGLRTGNKKDNEEINKLKAQVEEQACLLKTENGRRINLETATEAYRNKIDKLSEKLKDVEDTFSLVGKPLEFFEKRFLEISELIEVVSTRYFGRTLTEEEAASLQKEVDKEDSLLLNTPFSDSDESVHLRIAYARRVISSALHTTIWKPFSSDKALPGSECSKLLAEIEVELRKSNDSASSDATVFWKAATIRALESLPSATSNRVETVVKSVLQVLSPLLDPSISDLFNDDLAQIAKAAISVWVDAQADKHDFVINSTLNQNNTLYWKPVPFDGSSQDNQSVKGITDLVKVFTLFPIIICKQQIPSPKHPNTPGSFPEDQQPYTIETIQIHFGLGLADNSDLVQRGVEEKEEMKQWRDKYKEEKRELRRAIFTKKGGQHSRTNSISDMVPSPSSPKQSWMSNGRNNHPTEI
ncbi:hypothetical protein V497_00502 [Pseudogymnoascus sp. VKM F-4516 (FW-969)]|nr:hypothetical protein V497_00502 [Pseudogymnoascus sp. VKM F-4516 (FW-969)]